MIDTLGNIARMKPEVIDFTINSKCSQCGSCCSDYLPLSRWEIERIRTYVQRHKLREHIAAVTSGTFLDGTCPFRDNIKRRCDIYEVRPEICRCFKCDQDMRLINANKALLHQKNRVISMRGEFFGDGRSKMVALVMGGLLGLDT